MSFDLSQLDKLAKGELQERHEPKTTPSRKPATPRPRIKPQAPRRKLREDRRSSGPWSIDGEEVSESGPSRDVTGSKRSEQGSAVIPPDEPESPPDDDLETSEFEAPERQLPSKKRKGARRTSDDEGSNGGAKKKTLTRQNRLRRLAQVEDVSALPLCDLISRATYLEEKSLQQEPPTPKPPPPVAPPSPKPTVEPPVVSSIIAPQVTVVDGRLVVNEASLECAQEQQPDPVEGFTRVEESDDRIVNYHSYADWSTVRSVKWSREETELLVQGIGQFGIDFALLERLFPTRSRKQIKAKFSRMWKENPEVFGRHFNKAEGETDESYTKFVKDLRAERTPPEEGPLALPSDDVRH